MRFVIVTGMSGAGKSTALKMLEDVGYFCVDNLPFPLITKLSELALTPSAEINKIAVGVDIRSGNSFSEFEKGLDELIQTGFEFEILFLDSKDDVLIKRYKETRRNHPLAKEGRLDEGIQKERRKLEDLRKRADYILDTSNMLTRELKTELNKIFVENKEFKNIYVTVCSFGFKYGIPNDADLVFDVRCLPNPFYKEGLRILTGLDKEVRDYVFSTEQANGLYDRIREVLKFSVPLYEKEGKAQLVVAFGCTGGQHRSTAFAYRMQQEFEQEWDNVKMTCRDMSMNQHEVKNR